MQCIGHVKNGKAKHGNMPNLCVLLKSPQTNKFNPFVIKIFIVHADNFHNVFLYIGVSKVCMSDKQIKHNFLISTETPKQYWIKLIV